jgi:hypothetical protein
MAFFGPLLDQFVGSFAPENELSKFELDAE